MQQQIIKQAEATISATEADLTRFRLEAVRQKALLANGLAGTKQITEQAIDNEKRAEATLELNRAQLEQQRQQINVLDSQEKQAQAALEAQQAARDLAAINLGYTRITAPADGMVGERQARPGQYVSVGTQVISLVPLPNVWVVANYKETQMTHIERALHQRLVCIRQRCKTDLRKIALRGSLHFSGMPALVTPSMKCLR